MSATYNNQIEIVIFDNNRRTNEKAPTQTGTVTFPDGTKYQVALWDRVSKNGNPFRSGTLKLDDGTYSKGGNRGGNGGARGNGGSVEVDF